MWVAKATRMANCNQAVLRQGLRNDSRTNHLQPVNQRTKSENIRDGKSEEDPLQNPRPPEKLKSSALVNNRCHEQNLMCRAKRWSCRLSERASVLWGGWGSQMDDEPPPPVPRHRTESKYNASTSDRNHVRLLDKRTKSYTCRELMCIVFLPCLLICLLGIACSALVIYYQLGKVRLVYRINSFALCRYMGKYIIASFPKNFSLRLKTKFHFYKISVWITQKICS